MSAYGWIIFAVGYVLIGMLAAWFTWSGGEGDDVGDRELGTLFVGVLWPLAYALVLLVCIAMAWYTVVRWVARHLGGKS